MSTNFFENLFPKLSLKALRVHLTHFINLFINSRTQLKKSLSNRKEGKFLFVNYLIYFFLIILLIISEPTLTIKIFILELSTTLLPFLIFIAPFTFFVKKYNKKLNYQNLFKFLITLKIPLVVIILILEFIINLTGNEMFFIIINNINWIFWLVAIVALPLFLRLSPQQKIIWIIINYFWLNVCFLLLSNIKPFDYKKAIRLVSKPYFEKNPNLKYLEGNVFYEEFEPFSPDIEYSMFRLNSKRINIIDSHYVVYLKPINNKVAILGTQYLSDTLELTIKNKFYKELRKSGLTLENLQYLDSIHFITEGVNKETLDTLRSIFNIKFEQYKAYVKELENNCSFSSNEKYFSTLYEYLNSYESIHTEWKYIDSIVKYSRSMLTTKIEDSLYLVVLRLPTKYYPKYKYELDLLDEKFQKRHLISDLLMRIVLFPERFVINYIL